MSGTVRVKKKEKYTTLENALTQNSDLSWAARGMMGYLLSKPNNWETQVSDLIKQSPAGKEHVGTVLRELQRFGYIKREKVRQKDGTFAFETTVYEEPFTCEIGFDQCGKTGSGTSAGKPAPVKPAPVNPPLLSTDVQKTEKQMTERENASARAPRKVSDFSSQAEPETRPEIQPPQAPPQAAPNPRRPFGEDADDDRFSSAHYFAVLDLMGVSDAALKPQFKRRALAAAAAVDCAAQNYTPEQIRDAAKSWTMTNPPQPSQILEAVERSLNPKETRNAPAPMPARVANDDAAAKRFLAARGLASDGEGNLVPLALGSRPAATVAGLPESHVRVVERALAEVGR